MTEKRFVLVKCYNEQWGIVDKSLEDIDQLVLIATSKSGTLYLVNELNALHEENDTLKQQLKTKHIVNKQYEELQRVKEENQRLKQELYQQEVSEQRRKEYNEFWREKINKGIE